MNTEVKKLLRGKKSCSPAKHLWRIYNNGSISKGVVQIGKGEYGVVFRGCVDDKCNKPIVYKESDISLNEDLPTAKMEFTIAKKLEGMGVPKMYHYKDCDGKEIVYSEYIPGKELREWAKSKPSTGAIKSVMVQVIYNLYRIHKKYPGFRHHDLHAGNVMIKKVPRKNVQINLENKKYLISNFGIEPVIIDFGFSKFPRIKNPLVNYNNYKNLGISKNSHKMYDTHFFVNTIHNLFFRDIVIRKFIENIFPSEYLGRRSVAVKDFRLRGVRYREESNKIMKNKKDHEPNLPGFELILSKPFFTGETRVKNVIPKPKPKPKFTVPIQRPQPKVQTPNKTSIEKAMAIKRAANIIAAAEKQKAKEKKRPGLTKTRVKPLSMTRNKI